MPRWASRFSKRAWSQGQGGFLDKTPPPPEVHRIEKGRWSAATLGLTEVVAAVIHQDKLPRLDRGIREATHDSVSRLPRHRPLVRALKKWAVVAGAIEHQAGLEPIPLIGRHHRALLVVLNRHNGATGPSNTGVLAGDQPMALKRGLIKEAVVDAMGNGLTAQACCEVAACVAPAVTQQVGQAQGIHLRPPDPEGVLPGSFRCGGCNPRDLHTTLDER